MDIDIENLGHPTSVFLTEIPLPFPSVKEGIQKMEDVQRASSPFKRRRASTDTGGDDSLVSSPPMESPLGGSPRRNGGMEDVLLTMCSLGRKRTP